eukprot:m.128573 g.128573  ORF g.128573 m.128573 type:complete len:118 (+) comp37953_c0_seq46:5005-5358(+)
MEWLFWRKQESSTEIWPHETYLLMYKKFSYKSDVWSFGITMWEMWSNGATPWSGVASRDLASMLENRKKLEKPRNAYGEANCGEGVYNIMERCWKYVPNERPSFRELISLLTAVAAE